MEVDSDAEKSLWNFHEGSLSSYMSPSNLPSSSSLSVQQHTNPQSSPGGLLSTTAATSSGTVSKGKSLVPSVSSTTTGMRSTLCTDQMTLGLQRAYSSLLFEGSGKRRRVTDETVLQLPLDFG